MSLYGPRFHVTPVDLGVIFQCNLYIYPVSCLVEIKLFQIVSNCFKLLQNCFKLFQKLFQIVSSSKKQHRSEFSVVVSSV